MNYIKLSRGQGERKKEAEQKSHVFGVPVKNEGKVALSCIQC